MCTLKIVPCKISHVILILNPIKNTAFIVGFSESVRIITIYAASFTTGKYYFIQIEFAPQSKEHYVFSGTNKCSDRQRDDYKYSILMC